MHDYKQYVGILGKLPAEQANEFIGRFPVVHGQGAADAKHACLFSRFGRNGAGHRVLETRNALRTAALLGEADCFLRGWRNSGWVDRFRSLRHHDRDRTEIPCEGKKYGGLPQKSSHLEVSLRRTLSKALRTIKQ